MSDDMSQKSGEPVFGNSLSPAPAIVSLEQMWLKAAPWVHFHSSAFGMRVGMSFWQSAATLTVAPTSGAYFWASLSALADQVPCLP